MNILRLSLGLIFTSIAIYTVIVISNHGINLFPIFFGDIAKMAWPGQFNFDFLCFLILSGMWVAWRHRFSKMGILLSILAFFGGAFFLSGYLFFHSYKSKGDLRQLLLGSNDSKIY